MVLDAVYVYFRSGWCLPVTNTAKATSLAKQIFSINFTDNSCCPDASILSDTDPNPEPIVISDSDPDPVYEWQIKDLNLLKLVRDVLTDGMELTDNLINAT